MEELELTYLAKELPSGVKDSLTRETLDIYIPTTSRHPSLRIRRNGEKYEITKKVPLKEGDSSHMVETTTPLTPEEFDELERNIKGKRVRKTRFYYKENDIEYQIDVFRDNLSGLVLVDVEFDSQDKKNDFTPPPWCLTEVTQEEFIAGGMVCGKSYADIEQNLSKFGYKKIQVNF